MTSTFPNEVDAPMTSPPVWLMALLGFVLLIGCGGTVEQPKEGRENLQDIKKQEPDVDTERIEKVLDQEARKRREPSANSPGPYMISLFSRITETANFDKPGRKNRNRASGKNINKYIYIILLSKEWWSKRIPIYEPFPDIIKPQVKILNDRAMKWFLDFLEKNNFSRFPSEGDVSEKQIASMAHGDKILTLWKGEQRQQRVYFGQDLNNQLEQIYRSNPTRGKEMFQDKNNVIFGFQVLFNKAPTKRANVTQSNPRLGKKIKQLARKHNRYQRSNVEGKLLKARKLIKNKQYDQAESILKNILKNHDDHMYTTRARSLLTEIQARRRENEEN